MNLLEILLLLAGSLIFVVSFWLPAKKEEQLEGTKELAKEEISELVGQEMIRVKEHRDPIYSKRCRYGQRHIFRKKLRIRFIRKHPVHLPTPSVMRQKKRKTKLPKPVYDPVVIKRRKHPLMAKADRYRYRKQQQDHKLHRRRPMAKSPVQRKQISARFYKRQQCSRKARKPQLLKPLTYHIAHAPHAEHTRSPQQSLHAKACPVRIAPHQLFRHIQISQQAQRQQRRYNMQKKLPVFIKQRQQKQHRIKHRGNIPRRSIRIVVIKSRHP